MLGKFKGYLKLALSILLCVGSFVFVVLVGEHNLMAAVIFSFLCGSSACYTLYFSECLKNNRS